MTTGIIIGLVLCGVAAALALKPSKEEEKPEEFLSEEEEQAVLALRNKQAKEEGKFSSLFWEHEEEQLKAQIRARNHLLEQEAHEKKLWDDLMEELRSYE